MSRGHSIGAIRFSLIDQHRRERAKRYYARHKKKCFAANYRQRKKEWYEMTDNYVKRVIVATAKTLDVRLKYAEISAAMVTAKREQLQVERCLVKLTQLLKEEQ